MYTSFTLGWKFANCIIIRLRFPLWPLVLLVALFCLGYVVGYFTRDVTQGKPIRDIWLDTYILHYIHGNVHVLLVLGATNIHSQRFPLHFLNYVHYNIVQCSPPTFVNVLGLCHDCCVKYTSIRIYPAGPQELINYMYLTAGVWLIICTSCHIEKFLWLALLTPNFVQCTCT